MNNCFDKKIKDEIISLVDKKKLCSGLALTIGTQYESKFFNYGITGNNKLPVSENTIIDLASVTKLFLSFAYFYLYDLGLIDFNKSISYYSSRFKNIGDFSVSDLMHFNCILRTQNRITEMTYNEALYEIVNINGELSDTPLYSDMPSIALGLIFEDISKMSFGEFIDNRIIKKLNLNNTFWHTKNAYDDFMDYSGEIQIFNGEIKRIPNSPLIVNDTKAQILSNNGRYLCGHSGIFSSANDICKISQALLSGKIISKKSLNKIATIINTNIEQRFGNLCYCKSPNKHLTEVPYEFSDNAFAMSGFTGNYYCIDPQKDLFIFIGANKLSNRVSKCDSSMKINNSCINIDNQDVICSKDYVYSKDDLRDLCVKALMQ